MKKINHAFIMAAGRGARMRPLTDYLPKAMVQYKDTTLIANGINQINKYIKNIHISVGYKGSLLAKHVIENNVSTIINTEGKGNSWWIFNSIFKQLNKPMFILTCDNVIKINFKSMEIDYYKKKAPPCMLIPVKPVKGLEGDYIKHKNNLVTSVSRSIKADIYCTGIQVLNPFKINELVKRTENFPILWNRLINMKKLFVSDVRPKKWFAIDSLIQLEKFKKKRNF